MVNIPPVNLDKVKYRLDYGVVLKEPGPYGEYARKVVLPAQDNAVAEALIKMGWTPPPGSKWDKKGEDSNGE